MDSLTSVSSRAIHPRRSASKTASVRDPTASLVKMLPRWVWMVRTLRLSLRAMSLLGKPRAASRKHLHLPFGEWWNGGGLLRSPGGGSSGGASRYPRLQHTLTARDRPNGFHQVLTASRLSA